MSLEGETLKLIYITERQTEEERRKNTFICVKEKMKQEGCENLSQPRKLTGPDKHLLFLAGPAEQQHFLLRSECSPKTK